MNQLPEKPINNELTLILNSIEKEFKEFIKAKKENLEIQEYIQNNIIKNKNINVDNYNHNQKATIYIFKSPYETLYDFYKKVEEENTLRTNINMLTGEELYKLYNKINTNYNEIIDILNKLSNEKIQYDGNFLEIDTILAYYYAKRANYQAIKFNYLFDNPKSSKNFNLEHTIEKEYSTLTEYIEKLSHINDKHKKIIDLLNIAIINIIKSLTIYLKHNVFENKQLSEKLHKEFSTKIIDFFFTFLPNNFYITRNLDINTFSIKRQSILKCIEEELPNALKPLFYDQPTISEYFKENILKKEGIISFLSSCGISTLFSYFFIIKKFNTKLIYFSLLPTILLPSLLFTSFILRQSCIQKNSNSPEKQTYNNIIKGIKEKELSLFNEKHESL
jgi:hypothetical protein